MQQQQQDATMRAVTIPSSIFGIPGPMKTALGPRRIRRLPHRERFFESLDDG